MLRIRAVNWVWRCLMGVVVLLGALTGFAIPALVWENGLPHYGILSDLLILVAMPLVFVIGMALAWGVTIHETLELDMPHKRGLRRRGGLFWLAQTRDDFSLDGAAQLQLRSGYRRPTQLWLLMQDGSEHWLSFEMLRIYPGKVGSDAYLRKIAGYLQLDAPGEIVSFNDIKPRNREFVTQAAYKSVAPSATQAVPAAGQVVQHDLPIIRREPQTGDEMEKAGGGMRAFFGLFGCFLTILVLGSITQLISELSTGVIHSRGRTGLAFTGDVALTYWDKEPFWFLFGILFGGLLTLICGVFAWGSLRLALTGKIKK
ncbi:MAG: hypothetical protein LBG66_05810 [Gallionellaceae bacterium]|nr:hypothetical protein [Gallionellaceae bacterium]